MWLLGAAVMGCCFGDGFIQVVVVVVMVGVVSSW